MLTVGQPESDPLCSEKELTNLTRSIFLRDGQKVGNRTLASSS